MTSGELRFTATNEWCRLDGDILVIGITPHALAALGDVVYVELPEAGDDVLMEVPFGEIEGVNDMKELISPVDGVVTESNTRVTLNPDLMKKDAFKDGWLIRLKPERPPVLDTLLSQVEYDEQHRKKKGK